MQSFMTYLQTREEEDLLDAGIDLVIAGLKARFGLP